VERKRYGKTTVTIEKSQLERKTTQVTINSNPLSYFANLLFKANPENSKEEKKSNRKESPTLLVVRLTRHRSSSSCHPLTQVFLPRVTVQAVPPLCCVPVGVVVVGRKLERSEGSQPCKEPSSLPRLGNSHPCGRVTHSRAKILNRYLCRLSYS